MQRKTKIMTNIHIYLINKNYTIFKNKINTALFKNSNVYDLLINKTFKKSNKRL